MALALLAADDGGAPGARAFRFEIGHNRYYRYAVGSEERRLRHGIALLAEPVFVSELRGPVPESALGRGRFAIPEDLFSREDRFVQLMSYRTENLQGPAVSRIVESRTPLPDDMPALGFSAGASGRVLSRPFDYRVRPVSRAMFLDGLIGMLPGLLQPVGNILKTIGPALTSGDSRQIAGAVTSPDTLKQIADLVAQLLNQKPATATASGLGARWQRTHPQALGAPYSTAQVAPLAALLPMLMPLLQQVLTPETIKSVLDAPNKAAQTVINGVMDAARIGSEANKAHLEHLRQLNPGVDDPALDQLLTNMSLSLSGRRRGLSFKRSDKVRLAFEGLAGTMLGGQTRVLFATGRALRFPATVELPRLRNGSMPVLDPAVLQLQVKDHKTLDVLAEKRFRLPPVDASGPLRVTAELDAAEAERLVPGHAYLVSLALVWKRGKGEKRGAMITSRMDLVGPAVFDRVDQTGPMIDLSDPARFRDYWHRVWAGRLAEDAKQYAVEVSYVVAPAPVGRAQNARLETETRFAPRERALHTIEGRLKSGMELSPIALNDLLHAIAPEQRPLTTEELAALDDPEFREQLTLAARKPLSLRGRAGEAVAIWAYPTMRLATLVLAVPESIDETGRVTGVAETRVTLPMPAFLNLVGTRAR
jgi:hypothetical protein